MTSDLFSPETSSGVQHGEQVLSTPPVPAANSPASAKEPHTCGSGEVLGRDGTTSPTYSRGERRERVMPSTVHGCSPEAPLTGPEGGNAPAGTAAPIDDIPADVQAKFEELALMLHRNGHQRYSADGILHRIRWHFRVEKGQREFKCNNNWSAPLARWMLAKHPEMEGFFETRERRAA